MATIHDDLYFFPHMGFRPYKWVMQRDQYGDKPIRIVADDEYFGKLDKYVGPTELEITSADIPQEIGEGSAIQEPFAGHVTPGQPLTYEPFKPGWPPTFWNPPPAKCRTECGPPPIVVIPPIEPAPVPIPASGICILVGIAVLAALKRKRARR